MQESAHDINEPKKEDTMQVTIERLQCNWQGSSDKGTKRSSKSTLTPHGIRHQKQDLATPVAVLQVSH